METNFKSHMAHIFFCIPLFLIFFFSPIKSSGQCIASSDLTGNTSSNVGAVTDIPFNGINGGELASVDGNRAEASVTLNLLGSRQTRFIQVTGFNFSIPSDATICGITVTVVRRATTSLLSIFNKVTDNEVRLVKNGAVSNQENKASGEWQNNTNETVTYGGNDDLWSETALTPADVNSSNFGVAISANFEAGLLGILGQVLFTAEIDMISMTVHYSVPVVLPVTLYSFDAKLSNNTVHLNWGLAEQEEHANVTLQRSLNKRDWQDIYQYSLQNATNLQYYQFKDTLHLSGDYTYRLKLKEATGKITFSPVRTLSFKNNTSLIVYPNPAQSRLSVSASERIGEVTVTNLVQQKFAVPVIRLTDHSIVLNIAQLPAGVYFVHTQKNIARFIKE